MATEQSMYQGLSREQTQKALLNAIVALTNAVSAMPTVDVQRQLRDLALADGQLQSAMLSAATADPLYQTDVLAALAPLTREQTAQAVLAALSAILNKLPATPATEATLAALSAKTNKPLGSVKDYAVQPAPTSVQLAPANTARRGILLSNGANLPTFYRFGSAASVTSFNVVLPVGGTMLLPAITTAVHVVCASGVVTVISGMATLTELLD